MEYPKQILGHLERDPIVFWGCSNAEIMRSTRQSFLAAIVVLGLGLFIHWVVAVVAAFMVWIGYSYYLMMALSGKRADKPLFYEVHLAKKHVFTKANTRYQLYRNAPYSPNKSNKPNKLNKSKSLKK